MFLWANLWPLSNMWSSHPTWCVSATGSICKIHQKQPGLTRNLVLQEITKDSQLTTHHPSHFRGKEEGKTEEDTVIDNVLFWYEKSSQQLMRRNVSCGKLQKHSPRALHWLCKEAIYVNSSMIRPIVLPQVSLSICTYTYFFRSSGCLFSTGSTIPTDKRLLEWESGTCII